MKIISTQIDAIKIIKPQVFCDERGYFIETWQQQKFIQDICDQSFVQDNMSLSHQGVLRGLHYQTENTQGKLVSVMCGEIFDVAVDIRQGSSTFGQWVGTKLSSVNHHQLWIPSGFAHGFYVLSEQALISYKCTDFYNPNAEHTLLWNDLAIDWPLINEPIISKKDAQGKRFNEIKYLP